MAVSLRTLAATRARGRWPAGILRRRLAALSPDAGELWSLIRLVRSFAHGFRREIGVLILIGVLLVALDIAVPVVGARIVDAMAGQRPFEEVALLIVGLAALVWVPHGNLLPYLLELYDLKRFRVRFVSRIAVRCLELTLANPANARRLRAGQLARGDALPVLIEARDNLGRLMARVVRDLPAALRGLCVLVLLVYLVPLFVPFLLAGAAVDLFITWRMGACLRPHFQARQDAENLQRRLENDILSAHFGTALSSAQASALVAPYAERMRERIAREIAAEAPALRFKLQRNLVLNVTNLSSWLVGAWCVLVGGSPIGSFLFFVAWSSRAGELFAAVMNLQQEIMRARRSLRQLAALTGLDERPALPAAL